MRPRCEFFAFRSGDRTGFCKGWRRVASPGSRVSQRNSAISNKHFSRRRFHQSNLIHPRPFRLSQLKSSIFGNSTATFFCFAQMPVFTSEFSFFAITPKIFFARIPKIRQISPRLLSQTRTVANQKYSTATRKDSDATRKDSAASRKDSDATRSTSDATR